MYLQVAGQQSDMYVNARKRSYVLYKLLVIEWKVYNFALLFIYLAQVRVHNFLKAFPESQCFDEISVKLSFIGGAYGGNSWT